MSNNLPGNTDVLVCSYGGGHAAMLAPVARRLRQEGLAVEFLALTTAQPYLAKQGDPYFGYSNFPEANNPDVRRLGEELAADIPHGPVSREETIAYLGINYHELLQSHGSDAGRKLYGSRGRQAFLPIRFMERLIERTRPRLVITTNSPRSELALLRAAREAGLPSIALLDMFGLQEVKWLGTPDSATKVGVINERVRQFFIKSGCLPEQVVVTGNPAFDGVNAPESIAAGRIWRKRNSIPDGHKVVLWASQPEPSIHPFTGQPGDPHLPRWIEAEIRAIVDQHPDWHLVVRYHPSETVAFSPGERVILSPQTEPLHPLLHAADAVVVMTSTVGLEAHIAGVPVISVEMSVITPDAPFGSFGIARPLGNLAKLHSALKDEIARRRGGGRQLHASCEKVVALAKDLLAAKRPNC